MNFDLDPLDLSSGIAGAFVLDLAPSPASPSHARLAVRRLVAGATADWRAELAVSEAVSNAVMHAYRDTADGRIRVFGDLIGRRLSLVVEDTGSGLIPRADSPGLGFGLPLMASVTDELAIESTAAGTRLAMVFRV